MSSETDRIPVPTNGRKPHPTPDPATPSVADATPDSLASAAEADAGIDGPTSADFSVAFTPKQLAVGFGIIASLIVLLVGARRRRGGD